MKKLLKVLLSIVGALVALVLLVIVGANLAGRIVMNEFYSKAEKAFKTPGISDGFVQQGFDYVAEDDVFLVTGYMNDKSASRVYVVDKEGRATYTELKKQNGDDFTGHTGGIERNGEYVYITGGSGVEVFSYADILSAKGETKRLGTVKTYTDPAHCYIHEGYLYTGSFYIESDYETPDHEWMTTPSGEKNPSVITVFKLDDSKEFGIDNSAPVAVISSRRCVQGMCFTDDGKIVLSTSYGLSISQLFFYDTAKMTADPNKTVFESAYKPEDKEENFRFENVKFYYLDESNQVDVLKTPPMAEELVYRDGKIYIMSESASNKYIFGKLTSGNNVYAYQYKEE